MSGAAPTTTGAAVRISEHGARIAATEQSPCPCCTRPFLQAGFKTYAPATVCSFACADAPRRSGVVDETFPQRLRRLRAARRLTQMDLADRVGACDKSISLWELGKRTPGADTLALMARTFGVTMDYRWFGPKKKPAVPVGAVAREEVSA
jgi:DNA-binding XRE family transcriptional regulator